jgi:hypothetical protein
MTDPTPKQVFYFVDNKVWPFVVAVDADKVVESVEDTLAAATVYAVYITIASTGTPQPIGEALKPIAQQLGLGYALTEEQLLEQHRIIISDQPINPVVVKAATQRVVAFATVQTLRETPRILASVVPYVPQEVQAFAAVIVTFYAQDIAAWLKRGDLRPDSSD